MTEKDIFNKTQYDFLTKELENLGIGEKTENIYSILKKVFSILTRLNDLSEDLLFHIWSFIGENNDDIKLRCILMSCCKRWKNMLQCQKNVYINSIDVYDKLIPQTLLENIYLYTEKLVLNLNFKPRCFKSQWILSFISSFKKLKELVLITWYGPKGNDIVRLTKCVNLDSLKVIAGNNKMTIFHMDKNNKDSLLLDTIKIGYMNALNPHESYPHLSVLHCDNINWNYNMDQWNWFRGELYICQFTLRNFLHYKWLNLCHNIHIVDKYCHSLTYDEKPQLLNKLVVSYTNKNYFNDENTTPFDSIYINKLFCKYPNCKIVKILNFRKDAYIYFNEHNDKNLDLFSISSKFTLIVNNNICKNHVINQFEGSKIIFEGDLNYKKFIYNKKNIDNGFVYLQIQQNQHK